MRSISTLQLWLTLKPKSTKEISTDKEQQGENGYAGTCSIKRLHEERVLSIDNHRRDRRYCSRDVSTQPLGWDKISARKHPWKLKTATGRADCWAMQEVTRQSPPYGITNLINGGGKANGSKSSNKFKEMD